MLGVLPNGGNKIRYAGDKLILKNNNSILTPSLSTKRKRRPGKKTPQYCSPEMGSATNYYSVGNNLFHYMDDYGTPSSRLWMLMDQ